MSIDQSNFKLTFTIHSFNLIRVTDLSLESNQFLSVSQNLSRSEAYRLEINIFGQLITQKSITSSKDV